MVGPLIAAVCAALAFSLSGCGAQPTSQPVSADQVQQEQQERVSLDKTYEDDLGFSLRYPSEWTRENSNDSSYTTLYMPSGGVCQIGAGLLDQSIDDVSNAEVELSFDNYFGSFSGSGISTSGDYTRNDGDGYFLASAPIIAEQGGRTLTGTAICAISGRVLHTVSVAGAEEDADAIEAVIDSIAIDKQGY